jgi:hypothetical protein
MTCRSKLQIARGNLTKLCSKFQVANNYKFNKFFQKIKKAFDIECFLSDETLKNLADKMKLERDRKMFPSNFGEKVPKSLGSSMANAALAMLDLPCECFL